jgi:predicted enzyme related to lactoylglutathione lyase
MPDHPIVHIEFSASDLTTAAKFYSDLFGWKTEHMPEMNYATFEAPPGPGGGLAPVDGQMYNAGDVVVYVQTDDIEATLAKAESLGGSTVQPKTEIPGFGWFGLFLDPTGNRIGLYTAKPM